MKSKAKLRSGKWIPVHAIHRHTYCCLLLTGGSNNNNTNYCCYLFPRRRLVRCAGRVQALGGLSTSSRGRNHTVWSRADGPFPGAVAAFPPPLVTEAPLSSAGPKTPVVGWGPQYLSDLASITWSGTRASSSSSTFLSYDDDTCTLLSLHEIKKRKGHASSGSILFAA